MRTVTWLKSLSRIATIVLILVGTAHAAAPSPSSAPRGKATFAGGCFWCMEPPYDELDSVISTISGYIGGTKKNPTKVYRYGYGRDQRLQELWEL